MDDLSDLTSGVLGNSSMGGGNTVSVNPPFSPPGSENEAYEGVDTHSMPEPDLGDQASYWRPVPGGDGSGDGHGWTYPDADGDGWHGTRP